MIIRKAIYISLFLSFTAGTAPVFSSPAMNGLNTATVNPELAFHGVRGGATASMPATTARLQTGTPQSDEEIAVTARRPQGKTERMVKKAAPYVFVAGVGLWMGLAIAGGAFLPALAFAAVIMLFYIAAK